MWLYELLYKKFDLLEKLGIKSKENFKDEYNALKTNDNTLKSVIKQTKEFQDKIQPKIGPWNKIEFAIKGIGKSLYAILGPIGLITAGLTIISSIVGVIIGNIKDMIYDLKKLDDIRFSLDDDFEKALEPSKELSNKINTLFESFKSAENIEVKKSIFNQLKELLPFLSDVSFDNFIKGSKNIDKLSTSIANNNEQLQKQAELQFLLQDLENSKTGLKTAEDKVKAFEEKGDTAMYNIKSFVGDDNSFVQYKKLTDYGKAVKEVENYTYWWYNYPWFFI